jgi:hypothetical protein
VSQLTDVTQAIFATLALAVIVGCAGATAGAIQPENAADFIVSTFQNYPIVALDRAEGDGNQSEVELLKALFASSKLDDRIDDVVIESGNSRYQNVLDRYVSGGQVPLQELQAVWRESTQMFGAEADPTTLEVIQAVRARNLHSSEGHRIRVLAADPPINWNAVRTHAEYEPYLGERNSHAAAVVVNQVLERHERALLVIGGGHLTRRPPEADLPTITMILERHYPRSVYVIWALTEFDTLPASAVRKLTGLPAPSIFPIAGTWAGELDGRAITSSDTMRRVGNKWVHVSNAWPASKLEDLFEACLFLGPPSALKTVDLKEPTEPGFAKELARRRAIMSGAGP